MAKGKNQKALCKHLRTEQRNNQGEKRKVIRQNRLKVKYQRKKEDDNRLKAKGRRQIAKVDARKKTGECSRQLTEDRRQKTDSIRYEVENCG